MHRARRLERPIVLRHICASTAQHPFSSRNNIIKLITNSRCTRNGVRRRNQCFRDIAARSLRGEVRAEFGFANHHTLISPYARKLYACRKQSVESTANCSRWFGLGTSSVAWQPAARLYGLDVGGRPRSTRFFCLFLDRFI
jgi:hypothetical protein